MRQVLEKLRKEKPFLDLTLRRVKGGKLRFTVLFRTDPPYHWASSFWPRLYEDLEDSLRELLREAQLWAAWQFKRNLKTAPILAKWASSDQERIAWLMIPNER